MRQTEDYSELMGQVALITGASQGLGKVFAADLARQGMKIGLIARNTEHLNGTARTIRKLHSRALSLTADVTDRDAMWNAVDEVEAELGPIDVLINAAGSIMSPGPLWEADPDDWWKVLETNLRGTVNTCAAVAPNMCKRKRGRIINVASSTILHGKPYMSAYVTSKTAVVKFTEILSAELAEFGGSEVTAYSIHPGTVRTAMAQTLLRPEYERWIPWFHEIFRTGHDHPAWIGSALVQYLATGRASKATGRYFVVPTPGADTVEAIKNATPDESENANLLRIQIIPKHSSEAGA
jgi:NAD(P)-dependent dehydrogenase (short-subunit alcohol dehydrogenase family)